MQEAPSRTSARGWSIAAHLWLLLPRRTIGPSCSSSRSSVRLVMECIPAILQCAAYKRMLQPAGGSSVSMSRHGSTFITMALRVTRSLILISRLPMSVGRHGRPFQDGQASSHRHTTLPTSTSRGRKPPRKKLKKLIRRTPSHHPANIDQPRQEAAKDKNAKYLADYADDRRISFLPAVSGTSGRIDAEFLRLLFHHPCSP